MLTIHDEQEWQTKLSQRGVAQMPWDPKPVQPAPAPQPAMPSTAANGLPSSSYQNYETPPSTAATNNNTRIKQEQTNGSQYNDLTNGYQQQQPPAQGGLARAAQLVQEYGGQNASASVSAMQRAGVGLALPGQQQAKPQGLHLPGGNASSPPQQQFSPQQQQAMLRQQAQLQQQQNQPRIKVENESPQLAQGSFPQQSMPPNYSQTDGADDAHDQWKAMLAERRAMAAQQSLEADRMMRDQIVEHSTQLQSGLMIPLDEQASHKRQKRKHRALQTPQDPSSSSAPRSIPQLDGDYDDEDVKPDIKEEDEENAINSDLDDSDDDAQGPLGDDEDDFGDQILCTYDKVQRVKNKWKCTLKDGVMSVNGKEWVFHKATGEFEW